MTAQILVPDTNVLMQALPLDQVDWSLLGMGEEIQILVPLTVHKEINGFKNDPNARRARRARAVSKLLGDAALNPPYVIRQSSPRVTIGASPRPWKASEGTGLDLTEADQEIAGYTLSLMQIVPGNVALLTGDSGLIGIAVDQGIPVFRMPDEWLPKEEPDAKDRRIQELEREIAGLQLNFPRVTCQIVDQNGKPLYVLRRVVRKFQALSAQEVIRYAQQASRWHPQNQHIGANAAMQRQVFDALYDRIGRPPGHRIPPSEGEIYQYNQEYTQWANELHSELRDVHEKLTYRDAVLGITLVLNNDGGAPAQGVIVEVDSDSPDLQLLQRAPEYLDRIFKVPPEPPQGMTEDERFARMLAISVKQPGVSARADPRKFYWGGEGPGDVAQTIEAHCKEWRHGVEPVRLTFYAIASVNTQDFETQLRCRITASNLPRPVTCTLAVQVTSAPASAAAEAFEILKAELEPKR